MDIIWIQIPSVRGSRRLQPAFRFVDLYDCSGRRVKSIILKADILTDNYTATLDVSDLEMGSYFIKFGTDKYKEVKK